MLKKNLSKYFVLSLCMAINIAVCSVQPNETDVHNAASTMDASPNDCGGFAAIGAGTALLLGRSIEPYIVTKLCPEDPGAQANYFARNSYEKSLHAFYETALNVRMAVVCACSAIAAAGSFYTLYKDYKEGKNEPLKRSLLMGVFAVSAYGLLGSSEYLCQQLYNLAHFYWCESLKGHA